MNQKAVEDFAKSLGYATAVYLTDWRQWHCYEPILSEEDVSYIGLPYLILENEESEIRLSSADEAMQQIEETVL